MSRTNSKIEKAREQAIDSYISNCLEKYGKTAKECLDKALDYFVKNPCEEKYKLECPAGGKEFFDALRVCSTKSEYGIFVTKKRGLTKKWIKFYSEWPVNEHHYKSSIEITYKNLSRRISPNF